MAETVKTTLELPADLVLQIKLLAIQEHHRIKDVAADALRRGLLPEQREEEDDLERFFRSSRVHP